MNIIGNRHIFFIVSGILIGASVIAIVFFGLRFGIDFEGGTLWQFKIQAQDQPTTDDLRSFFQNDLKAESPVVYTEGSTQSFIVRFGHVTEDRHQQFLSALRTKYGDVEELRFDAIGPAVGKGLRDKAIWSIVTVLFGISLYVTFAFRKVSYPVKSWKYGVVTLITLFHDVVIPVGLFAVLGRYLGVDMDINFVVAVLVVMGFSVHDTIVVFDRIRENLSYNKKTLDFWGLAGLINASVNQTIARSFNTSLTLVLVLLAMFFLGPASLHYFILAILVGVVGGTYSSIFIASPGLLLVSGLKAK